MKLEKPVASAKISVGLVGFLPEAQNTLIRHLETAGQTSLNICMEQYPQMEDDHPTQRILQQVPPEVILVDMRDERAAIQALHVLRSVLLDTWLIACSDTNHPMLIIEAMQAAKRAGAVTSFDLNFRAKLWNIWGGEKKAVSIIDRIVKHVDVLVGNEEDLQKGLGIPGPDVKAKSKLDPAVFFGMIDKVTEKYPNVKIVATTLRDVHSTSHHSWSAVAWVSGKTYSAPTCELHVYDRVGGGDGFASGFIYGLMTNESPEEAVKLGWAHGALLTTYPGDTTMATVEEVKAFAKGGSARIQR